MEKVSVSKGNMSEKSFAMVAEKVPKNTVDFFFRRC